LQARARNSFWTSPAGARYSRPRWAIDAVFRFAA
jgi:hypothetical protein